MYCARPVLALAAFALHLMCVCSIFTTHPAHPHTCRRSEALKHVSLHPPHTTGTRYHSVMRVGFWNHLANWYRAREHQGVCRGPVDPRVVVDYRWGLRLIYGT